MQDFWTIQQYQREDLLILIAEVSFPLKFLAACWPSPGVLQLDRAGRLGILIGVLDVEEHVYKYIITPPEN